MNLLSHNLHRTNREYHFTFEIDGKEFQFNVTTFKIGDGAEMIEEVRKDNRNHYDKLKKSQKREVNQIIIKLCQERNKNNSGS